MEELMKEIKLFNEERDWDVEDVVQDRIEENIDRRFYEKMGYHTSQSERKFIYD